jgi:hypothetical protein
MSRHPVIKRLNKWTRKGHRWGAVLVALPVLVVISTGLLLQMKKQSAWIQPPTQKGVVAALTLTFDEILTIATAVPQAGLAGWDDIDRLDVRPSDGVVKVRGKNRWEVQIDATTGKVLMVAYRRSDLIESLHDGTWFLNDAKLWVFLPCGVVLLVLWITGIYLWMLPIWAKRSGRRRRAGAA